VNKFRLETWHVPSILGRLIEPAAIAMAGAWLTPGLAGLWTRERSRLDNLGIALGLSWIALDVFARAALCFDRGRPR
jgi:hypothetical protein